MDPTTFREVIYRLELVSYRFKGNITKTLFQMLENQDSKKYNVLGAFNAIKLVPDPAVFCRLVCKLPI